MSNQRRVGFAVAAAVALASAAWLLSWMLSPSTAVRYERLQLGMTLEQCQAAVGSAGTADPIDTTGRRWPVRTDGANTSGRRHYWELRDGVLVGTFDAGGALVQKVLLR